MIQWNGQTLESLSRSDVECAAAEAISEALALRERDQRRQSCDGLVLSFALGASFTAAAAIVGVLLH
jgi:hypothetical protein